MLLRRNELENDVCESEGDATGWKGKTMEQLRKLDLIPDFKLPDLRKLACGPYVLSLAIRYHEHANNVIFRVNEDFPNSLQITGIVSRHSKNDENVSGYTCYFRFAERKTFADTVSYCTCKVGNRCAGLCAHETAALYVLYHRYYDQPMPDSPSPQDHHITQLIDCMWYEGAHGTLQTDTTLVNDDNELESEESVDGLHEDIMSDSDEDEDVLNDMDIDECVSDDGTHEQEEKDEILNDECDVLIDHNRRRGKKRKPQQTLVQPVQTHNTHYNLRSNNKRRKISDKEEA